MSATFRRPLRLAALTTLLAGLAAGGAYAGEDGDAAIAMADEADDVRRCVKLYRVDRTDIIDDRNILFYMRNGEVLHNQLPRRCPGLRSADAFSYRTSLNELCNVDVITVIRPALRDFDRGATCGLGEFRPISEAGIALLKSDDVAPEQQDPPPVEK